MNAIKNMLAAIDVRKVFNRKVGFIAGIVTAAGALSALIVHRRVRWIHRIEEGV